MYYIYTEIDNSSNRIRSNSSSTPHKHTPFSLPYQSYEARIDALQKQVEEQNMTMSMYSCNTEEFNHDEDIFGKWMDLPFPPLCLHSCSS